MECIKRDGQKEKPWVQASTISQTQQSTGAKRGLEN